MIFMRNCPMCKTELFYKTISQHNDACKNNRTCKLCALSKRKYSGSLEKICVDCNTPHKFSNYHYYKKSNSPYRCKRCAVSLTHKGKQLTEHHKNTLRNLKIGSKLSEITKRKISEKMKGKNNPCFGRRGCLHPMYGKSGKLSPTFGMKPWTSGLESPFSSSTILKMKKSHKRIGKWCGEKNPNYGNHNPLSDERRRKLRLSHIQRIEQLRLNGCKLKPNFNVAACKIIDDYGKQHGYNFQHAMNGGEFFISHLGYWVDGYDKDKNAAVDFYEDNKHHYDKTGMMKEKDIKRIEEIKNHLGCEFIVLEERNL